ncbi:amino acid adenylation domain-containing protein [Virgibacillus pantothenticus]
MTSNGKIDIKALPEPHEYVGATRECTPPRDHIEERLLYLLKEVLLLKGEIGIEDNFFDLGGHSLKAFTLSSKVYNEFNIKLPLSVIFEKPTVKEIAAYLRESNTTVIQTIKPVEIQDNYPLSSAQKRMFIENEINKHSVIYNIPSLLKLRGVLNKERLMKAFHELIDRHEVLRTGFYMIDDLPVQKVYEKVEFDIQDYHLKNNEIEDIFGQFVQPFDLTNPPLLRVGIITIDELTHFLMVDLHHIVADAESIQVLINEIVKLYKDISLPVLNLQYKDYATWQQKEIERNAFTKQEEYWMDFLSGELPVLQLPTDYKRGVTQTYEGCSLMFDIDIQLAKRIEDLAKMNNVTPYMVYLAGYYSLLFRYTGQEDIIIGTPTSGRTRSELDNMFGVFFNLLPLRNQLTGKNSFIDFLLKLKYNVTKSFENQDYPFENLLEKISINRKLSRHPLFDAVFALQKSLDRSIYMGDVTVELSHNSTHTSKFDLMLTVLESEDKLCFEIEYSADLFTNQTIKKIGEAYLRVLEQIVENPYQKLSAIDILSDNEKSQLLIDFNNTEVYYPKKKLLHQLFEEQVIITPDKVAIVCNEQTLTYRELNEKSNRLARVLRNHGVTNQSVVGVAVERSVEMVIGIVAILKAGAAFLPMDITLPDTRIQFMLDECRVEWMLVNSHSFVSNNFGRKIVNLKEVQQIDNCTTDNLEFVNQPEDLAYILYTSGSTGTPKGVMIEHQSVHNFFIGMQEHLEFHEQNTILAFTNISFDIFIVETLLPLTKGMKVVIADKNTLGNIGEITQDIIAHNVDVLQMTPSTMSLFIKEARDLTFLKGIKKIMIGGDKFPQNLFEELRINSTATIYNMYGPTETTIWSSIKKLTSDSKQSIGRPIANTKMYILDSHDQLVPIGFIGELCIGGDGLSRGYINRENLTNAKFIDSPFENGTKIYKTGDLARRLPNGEIEYVGRSDSQIKLRGYRIELGEIESLLNKYFTDLQSIVTVKELNDTLFICAYLVTSTNHDSNEIRDYLQTYLPVYMIPSYFIHIDKIPLSNNGKVDRNALPMPIVGENTKSIQVPTNLLEKKLMDLWADILSTDTFGIDDNFFELGGHSLRAISLVNRIHKDLGIHILLTDLFTNSTIKSLADFINRSRKSDYINIHPVEKANYYPLSSTQQRMFILNQLDKEDTSYNMLMSLQIKGNIDKKKIECSFNKLIERHEALRTRFEFKEGQPVQIVENQLSLNIESLNIKEEQLTNTLQYIRRPFDLMKSPLIRVTLIETDKSNGFLIVEIHHILCDGLSTQIILDEFIKIYHNKPLPKLSLYYKDYAVWQQEMMDTPVYTNQEKYWLNEFIDPIPILNLPADYSRPSIKSFTGGEVFTKLDLSVVTRLNHFARTEKTTIYNILFSAYSILLHKYSEQEELCIGTTLNGRNHDALELMIGVFVNTMPVRVRTERNKDYTDFLNEIGYKTLELLTNQDYQFDTLVKKLGLQGNLSRNPIFDVAFTFNTMRLNSIQINDLEVRPYRFEHMTSQFDLQLIVTESEDSIELIMEYSTDLYKKETITEMMENYLEILQQIIDNPEKKIEEFHIESRIKKNKEALLNQYSSFDF